HAREWYEKCLSAAQGIEKARIEKRMNELGASPQGRSKKERWISYDATYKASTVWAGCIELPALLAGVGRLHGESAFSTGAEPGAHIVIDLGYVKNVSRVEIENRRNCKQGEEQRARDLTLWLSTSPTERGKPAWRAPDIVPMWNAVLPQVTSAR